MSTRGAGPLNWRTDDGLTPGAIRGGHPTVSYSTTLVTAILDAADEAHIKRLYEENEIGGQARQVVGDVAVALGVVLGDTGPRMSVWDPANMRRVVVAARALKDERDEYHKAAEEADAKLRKIEYGCETPESHNYGCPCIDRPIEFLRAAATVDPGSRALREELAALREAYEKARADAEHCKAACEFKPISVELNGPLWPFLAGPDTTETDELRATIVSQAREIARLKGESA
ncbi:hypothetical protein ACIQH0_28180 [Streptomyces griseus]|uniref:hypothetical protein n=1 Tax=Streptomyces griseus TaxID=1911 RepID=UPI0038242076